MFIDRTLDFSHGRTVGADSAGLIDFEGFPWETPRAVS
jgi:hypothetical protein